MSLHCNTLPNFERSYLEHLESAMKSRLLLRKVPAEDETRLLKFTDVMSVYYKRRRDHFDPGFL